MSSIKTLHGTVHISDGNMKMGATPSFSVPAIITCRKNAPCYRSCYATQGTFAWDNTQQGYFENKYLVDKYTEEVRIAVVEYIKRKKVKFFRWNVSGDAYSATYISLIGIVACMCPDTKFLCFTKQYELWNEYIEAVGGALLDNLSLMYSKWEGLDIHNPHRIPTTHVIYQDGHTTAGHNYHLCPGNCETCQDAGMGCWAAKAGDEVAFHIHGPRLKYSPEAQESSFRKFCEKLNEHAKEWGLA